MNHTTAAPSERGQMTACENWPSARRILHMTVGSLYTDGIGMSGTPCQQASVIPAPSVPFTPEPHAAVREGSGPEDKGFPTWSQASRRRRHLGKSQNNPRKRDRNRNDASHSSSPYRNHRPPSAWLVSDGHNPFHRTGQPQRRDRRAGTGSPPETIYFNSSNMNCTGVLSCSGLGEG